MSRRRARRDDARRSPRARGPRAREDDAVEAARGACAALGIRHHAVDMRQQFLQDVVSCFLDEYARGRTPNPCLECNRALKFGGLLEWARREGFDMLATGHYARTDERAGRHVLLAGLDRRKDQSYFLYALGQAQLAQLLFPLGALTKEGCGDGPRAGLAAAGREPGRLFHGRLSPVRRPATGPGADRGSATGQGGCSTPRARRLHHRPARGWGSHCGLPSGDRPGAERPGVGPAEALGGGRSRRRRSPTSRGGARGLPSGAHRYRATPRPAACGRRRAGGCG